MITDQPDAMPVFVIKAKDKLALSAVFSYQMLCENAGLYDQAGQVALAVEEIREWQRRNPDRLQLPDHPHVPVEGSTPLDSPSRPCGMHYSWPSQAGSEAGTMGPCVLDVADHHERHRDEHGNEWLNVQWALDRLDAAPAGEVASGDVVEAIMDTIDCYPGPVAGGPTRAHIEQLIREYAAGQRAEGVEEGRRQATEERTEEKITPATAYLMPRPRGYVCAAGCGHADSSHRELGCDVDPCECPAPFGRILPSAEATDHG